MTTCIEAPRLPSYFCATHMGSKRTHLRPNSGYTFSIRTPRGYAVNAVTSKYPVGIPRREMVGRRGQSSPRAFCDQNPLQHAHYYTDSTTG